MYSFSNEADENLIDAMATLSEAREMLDETQRDGVDPSGALARTWIIEADLILD